MLVFVDLFHQQAFEKTVLRVPERAAKLADPIRMPVGVFDNRLDVANRLLVAAFFGRGE